MARAGRESPQADPVEEVARFMQEKDLFARHLGIRLLELRSGYCRAALQLEPYMVNGLGLPHGAVIFSIADFAFAAACNASGREAVALSMDIHFLASPEAGAELVAEAEEVQSGQRTGLYEISVRERTGRPIAALHGMAYRKDRKFIPA